MDQLNERLKNMTPLQRAVFALKETQSRLEALEQRIAQPIAVVGMACRFPGKANDPMSFWCLLCDGVDAVTEIPSDRWIADQFYDPDPLAPGKMNTRWGGFLEHIDQFDNHFFAISDPDATRIDPQHRILLELAWEALEDAGLPPTTLRGSKIGVFVGISLSEYGLMLSNDLAQTSAHAVAGTSLCLAANRLSFALGLQGPSIAIDTACSSSLVAVHLACQSLRNGECEGAFVAGANLLLSPIGTINLTKAGFSASDGRVHAFDAGASGYVRSEGAGMVVLKPLAAALKNKDPIYAVIRGTAVNQNGSSNGLTAPSRSAQEQLLREAYARSQVSSGLVQFVETQGTGTRLGDTIEAMALGAVLQQDRPPGTHCVIGALKTNVGHLEAASGIASLMKTALVLKHAQFPPNLHFHSPNPDIPFDTLPLRVPRQLEAWPASAYPRFAGVSAFGFGGSNAHVVLEEPPAPVPRPDPVSARALSLLPLSSRTDSALHDLALRYRDFLAGEPPSWSDVCYTAAARRQHYDCRLAILADSNETAIDRLNDFLAGKSSPGVLAGRKPFGRGLKVAFVYDEQVAPAGPLLAQLIESVPGFSEAVQTIDAACQRVAGGSLATIGNAPHAGDPLRARTSLLALQLAMTAWWRRLGITADIVLGQGVGELAAAATAGVLTTDEAIHLAVSHHSGNGTPPPDRLRPQPASLPFLSAVDGRLHSGTDLDRSHWQSCIQSPGDLSAMASTLAQRNVDLLLGIGRAPSTSPLHRLLTQNRPPESFVPSLLSTDLGANALAAVGRVYAAGADLVWQHLAPANARCVRVPTYPWQRQKLWALQENRWVESHPRPSAADDASQTQPSQAEPAAPAKPLPRPDLSAPYVAPQSNLERAMLDAWSTILRIDGIGIHDNFFELGGDSLQATILLNRLEAELGQPIPGHVLFRIQTVHDLADYLRQHCPAAVQRRYPDKDDTSDEAMGAGAVPDNLDSASAAQDTSFAAPLSIPRLARDQQAEDLLARLDELSDEEVEMLLREKAGEGEVSDE